VFAFDGAGQLLKVKPWLAALNTWATRCQEDSKDQNTVTVWSFHPSTTRACTLRMEPGNAQT